MTGKVYPNPDMYGTWQEWAAALLQALEQEAPDADARAAVMPPAASKFNLGRVIFDTSTGQLKFSNGTVWKIVTAT
jgi:hypothetical protein